LTAFGAAAGDGPSRYFTSSKETFRPLKKSHLYTQFGYRASPPTAYISDLSFLLYERGERPDKGEGHRKRFVGRGKNHENQHPRGGINIFIVPSPILSPRISRDSLSDRCVGMQRRRRRRRRPRREGRPLFDGRDGFIAAFPDSRRARKSPWPRVELRKAVRGQILSQSCTQHSFGYKKRIWLIIGRRRGRKKKWPPALHGCQTRRKKRKSGREKGTN